jgi:excisionase family DNA binding protein
MKMSTDPAVAVAAMSTHLNLNVVEAAAELRVSSRTVRNLIACGELQKHRIGRRVLISRKTLAAFIRKREAAEEK